MDPKKEEMRIATMTPQQQKRRMIDGPDSTPRFTIITPTYNRAGIVTRCLDSILAQSFGNFEAIVVDDGSTDDTAAVVAQYCARDPRVRYVYQDNQGANAARNNGASTARGEYLLVFDDDDEAYPDWLATLDGLISSSRPAVACCGIDLDYGQGRELGGLQPPEELVGSARGGLFLSGTYAVQREVFDELAGFAADLPAHQSTEFRMRLYGLCDRRGYRIASVSNRLVRGHEHTDTRIRSDARAKLEATKYILKHHRDKFQYQHSIASWLASAGGCAAELGLYAEARRYFAEAICAWPRYWKNYARLAVCSVPGVRRLFWRATGHARLD